MKTKHCCVCTLAQKWIGRSVCSATVVMILGLWLFLSASTVYATDYFVAVGGNNGNDGLSEAKAWKTINFAANFASLGAGDTVYVKAGTYNEEVSFSRGGRNGNPVIFEGYTGIPGDKPETNYQLNDALKPRVMPLLNRQDRTSGTAFMFDAEYITVKNFQITEYERAIVKSGV